MEFSWERAVCIIWACQDLSYHLTQALQYWDLLSATEKCSHSHPYTVAFVVVVFFLVGFLKSQLHARCISGKDLLYYETCCHAEKEVAVQTFCFTPDSALNRVTQSLHSPCNAACLKGNYGNTSLWYQPAVIPTSTSCTQCGDLATEPLRLSLRCRPLEEGRLNLTAQRKSQ